MFVLTIHLILHKWIVCMFMLPIIMHRIQLQMNQIQLQIKLHINTQIRIYIIIVQVYIA